MAEKPSFAYSIIIIIVLQRSSLALRNYVILLDEVKCTLFDGNYALSNFTCTTTKVDIQLKKEVQRPFVDFIVQWKLPNRRLATLFRANRIDYCLWKRDQTLVPILNVVTDMLEKAGSLPKSCPIAANYQFRFINFTVDAEYFPVYAPNTDFIASLAFYNRKDHIMNINGTGAIVNKTVKKKNKSRKIS